MQPTENQRQCIQETFGVPSAIRAGAGSGKTATLTNRIVYALQNPQESGVTDIDQILAITFTKKAAGELKSRIKGALQQAAASDSTRADYLYDQALKVDGAWISTIHGMCSRLISENAFALGVDPQFEVLSDDMRAQMLRQACEEVLSLPQGRRDDANLVTEDADGAYLRQVLEEYSRGDVVVILESLVDLAAPLGKRVGEVVELAKTQDLPSNLLLRDFVRVAGEIYDMTAAFGAQKSKPSKSVTDWMADAEAAFCGIEQALEAKKLDEQEVEAGKACGWEDTAGSSSDVACNQGNSAFAPQSVSLCAQLEDCILSDEEALELLAAFPVLNGRIQLHSLAKGGSMQWEGRDVKLAEAYYSSASRIARRTAVAHLTFLVRAAQEVQTRFEEAKRAKGVLDNNDFLALAARLLDENPQVRERYARRFQLVMVDEFQDTDQVQLNIINRLAGAVAGEPAPAGESAAGEPAVGEPAPAGESAVGEPAPAASQKTLSSKVCVVGDAQQSIYRFRSADLAVFNDYVGRVEAQDNARLIRLDDNFRSHPDILAFVKAVFQDSDDCLDLNPGRSEEYLVKAGKQYKGSAPRVRVLCPQNASADEQRKSAARKIARAFRQLCDEGHNPSQMVVLLGAMSNANLYARALLDEGLPCAITGGSVLRKMPEAQLMVDLAAALVDPGDTASLASVLSSDVFGLNAEDLLQLMPVLQDCEGTWHHLYDELIAFDSGAQLEFFPESPRLMAALRTLGMAAQEVGCKPLSRILQEVLARSAWLLRMHEQGQAAAGNAFKVIRMFEELENAEYLEGLSLVRRVQSQLSAAKLAPGVLSAQNDRFVRIMTIHASKGLEFPIVAIADAEGSSPDNGKLKTLSHRGRHYVSMNAGFSLKDYEKTLPGRADAKLKEVLSKDNDYAYEEALGVLAQKAPEEQFHLALKKIDDEENQSELWRKIYVAYTRASEALILVPGKKQQEALGETFGIDFSECGQRAVAKQVTFPNGSICDLELGVSIWNAELGGRDAGAEAAGAVEEKLEGAEAASGAGCDIADAEEPNEEARTPFPVFDQPLQTDCPTWHFAPRRAKGILSASAIMAAQDDEHGSVSREREAGELLAEESDFETAAFDGRVDSGEGARLFESEPERGRCGEEAPAGAESQFFASAVDRGSAFHAVAQWAAEHRDETGLARPSEERVRIIASRFGLSDYDTEHLLHKQLPLWLESDIAQEMAAYRHLRAEVPFLVPFSDAEGRSISLNGFIDLLAFEQLGQGEALVVDYKTGSGLAPEERREHYLAQAQTYAYVLLQQGFSSVRLRFVYVDVPDGGGEPTIVEYSESDCSCLPESLGGFC